MMSFPTPLDFWLAGAFAGFASTHRQAALAVESGIRHTVFGGIWFGGVLFVLWVRSERTGGNEARRRVLTIVAGSVTAILISLLAGTVISWPPPIRDPAIAVLYPPSMLMNLNTNCFPSVSTAAYGSIAAGVYSLHKATGWALWALVAVFIGLPRMIVGGHYFTDVVAGAALGLAGYAVARYLLETKLVAKIDLAAEGRAFLKLALQVVMFVWIFQVTVEFREITWAKAVLEYFFH